MGKAHSLPMHIIDSLCFVTGQGLVFSQKDIVNMT